MKYNKNINTFKIINPFNQIFYFLVIFLLIIFFKVNLKAHELWLEPQNFKFDNEKILKIDIKIGQNFEGSAFGYYNPLKKDLYFENSSEKTTLEQRDGNFPAIQTLILDKGLHILNYETNSEKLKYETIEKFIEFLAEQNFQNFEDLIVKDKLPTESYKRFAKVLLTDGSEDFFVQKPKLDFEIIALNSPYDQKNNFFRFQLFKKTKPFGNWQIIVFSKDEENIFKENVKTNTNGVGKLKLFDNRIYLLSAVYIEKNSYFKKINKEADWSSEWASLVFRR